MCGIFGYFGKQTDGANLTVNGLKNLEYRGYDSWGVAWQEADGLHSHKSVGKISEAPKIKAKTSLAVAHTRWATQGEVSERNAHPHFSSNGEIAVVHNGVIENYLELKKIIGTKKFKSETDTEVIAHWIQKLMDQGKSFEVAFRQTLNDLHGRNAVIAIHAREKKLLAGRIGSPLILGVGKGEWFLASDIPAFLEHTQTVNYLDDGEMVILSEKGAEFKNVKTGKPVQKRDVKIDWSADVADKGTHAHFMIKEILDQKQTIAQALRQDLHELRLAADLIRRARGTYFIGCGTAGNVCHAGTYFFTEVADRHVNYAPASEFPIYNHFLKPDSLVIAVSQSGETADVLEAIEAAKRKGAKVLAIVNVQGSSIARMADSVLLLNAGPEKAVASTKAATSQMAVLLLLAYAVAGKLEEGRRVLLETSEKINDMLNPRYIEHIRKIAKKYAKKSDLYIVGKGANYPMALEAAIKIMEVSYIHAHGFAGGELKHGPIALIEKGTPCLALVGEDEFKADMLTASAELKTRGAKILGIGATQEDVYDEWLRVPNAGIASPLVNIIPAQLLAYEFACAKGLNPDMPRNLAKSVTVK